MALKITDRCIACWACPDVCPNDAIVELTSGPWIDPGRCTECLGDHADPQCASICPIEVAIIDPTGTPLNPPGSLTGIPPARSAAAATTPPSLACLIRRPEWPKPKSPFPTSACRSMSRSGPG